MEKPRLFFIDNLRILVITQVMMLHLSISYGGEGSWYYKEGRADMVSTILLTWHNGAVQAFSMGLFFLIAGYFTVSSYDRKGPGQFLKDRLLRLGIPMLCFDFVIGPLMAYPLIKSGAWGATASYRDYITHYYSRFHIGTGPLWFVEALLIFSIVYVLCRAYVKRTAPAAQSDHKLPSNLTIAAFALAMGAVSFAVRIWLPIGWAFGPLNFQFPFFSQYICMFIIGIVAYRRNWLTRIPDTMGRLWLFVALFFIIVLVPVLFMTGGVISGNVAPFLGGLHWQCFAYAVWEQVTGVAIITALLFLFRKYLNQQGKTAKAASASAYTAYVIHTPVIILVAIAIRNIILYPLLKFVLAVLIAVPLCFALSNVIRKLPLARRIL